MVTLDIINKKEWVIKMNEKELRAKGYKKYHGKDIDVYFNKDICQHSGNCVRGNGAVFEVGRRPWVLPDNATADTVAQVIETCPSGALKYIRHDK